MAKWTINSWNAKIDRSLTKRILGKNKVLYEYELPYGADSNKYYEQALNVKSIKRSTQYDNGKRPGQYQPIGDKRYFTYYQLKKMSAQELEDWNIQRYAEIVAKKLMEDFPL